MVRRRTRRQLRSARPRRKALAYVCFRGRAWAAISGEVLLTKDEARLMQYVTRAFGAYGVHRFDQANQIAQARRAARMCQHRAHR